MLPWKDNNDLLFVLLINMWHCHKYNMYLGLHAKCLAFLSDFNQILDSVVRFQWKATISNLMKICQVEAQLIHAHRWKGRHYEANRCFSSSCMHQKSINYSHIVICKLQIFEFQLQILESTNQIMSSHSTGLLLFLPNSVAQVRYSCYILYLLRRHPAVRK